MDFGDNFGDDDWFDSWGNYRAYTDYDDNALPTQGHYGYGAYGGGGLDNHFEGIEDQFGINTRSVRRQPGTRNLRLWYDDDRFAESEDDLGFEDDLAPDPRNAMGFYSGAGVGRRERLGPDDADLTGLGNMGGRYGGEGVYGGTGVGRREGLYNDPLTYGSTRRQQGPSRRRSAFLDEPVDDSEESYFGPRAEHPALSGRSRRQGHSRRNGGGGGVRFGSINIDDDDYLPRGVDAELLFGSGGGRGRFGSIGLDEDDYLPSGVDAEMRFGSGGRGRFGSIGHDEDDYLPSGVDIEDLFGSGGENGGYGAGGGSFHGRRSGGGSSRWDRFRRRW